MLRTLSFTVLMLCSLNAMSGPLAEQFASGYNGIAWGTSLVNLVGTLPGGQHLFATTSGEREYALSSDEPFLGVPRPAMTTAYGLDKEDRFYIIGINVPYEYRVQLIGALISSFGAYTSKKVMRTQNVYDWPKDGGVLLTVRESRSDQYGILQVVISRRPSP